MCKTYTDQTLLREIKGDSKTGEKSHIQGLMTQCCENGNYLQINL